MVATSSSSAQRDVRSIPDTLNGKSSGALEVQSFGVTDPGKLRGSNEDQFLIARLTGALWVQQSSLAHASPFVCGGEQGHLFVVADGMGGVAGGERASSLAVGTIEELSLRALRWLLSLDGANEVEIVAELKTALHRADARICAEATRDPEVRGMGTTVTLAYSFGSQLFIVHVGDSRAYLFRDGRIYRLTQDHTLVEQMVAQGVLTPKAAAVHALRHVVTNIVGGTKPGVQAEVHKLDVARGDRLVLCTDGLTGMLTGEQLAAILVANPEPRAAAEVLVRSANDAGGHDNVTAIVANFAGKENRRPD